MQLEELAVGDVILFQGGGVLARGLRWIAGDTHSHCALVVGTFGSLGLRVIESMPFRGPWVNFYSFAALRGSPLRPVVVFRPKTKYRPLLLNNLPKEIWFGWATYFALAAGRTPGRSRRGLTSPELAALVMCMEPLFVMTPENLHSPVMMSAFAPGGQLVSKGLGRCIEISR